MAMKPSPAAPDLVWFPAIQGWSVVLRSMRAFYRLAIVAALLLACGLGACGRKGALDLPPGAALESDTKTAATSEKAAATADPDKDKKVKFGSIGGQKNLPPTPKGANKSLPIDVLLD